MNNNLNSFLKVNEIFYSIQGESSYTGLPCIFIRLTYCNLRCVYCDTEYAFYEGKDLTISNIISQVQKYNCNLVEITGGEPLVQDNVHILINSLCNLNYEVLIETGGSLSIGNINPNAKIIMDIKTPGSKMEHKNRYENIYLLKPHDEVKFVITSYEDYLWAKNLINKFNLDKRVKTILFSPEFENINNIDLAQWILKDNLNVRFQLQLHKYIWHPETRGV
jgi:7-carboxy-7-deazaguanine synthase